MSVKFKEVLSPRQYEVVCSLAQGLDNSEIANQLGTTTGNISMLLSTICKRLGITSKFGISLREQLVNLVKKEMEESDAPQELEVVQCTGGGQMSEDANKTVAVDAEKNCTATPTSAVQSCKNIDIVHEIRKRLCNFLTNAKDYETALRVIEEVTSCKG